eukprot:COSAG03_NODE_18948_length_345_cov_0.825203_2_plen_49_part_01
MGVCYLAEQSVDATEKYAEQARFSAEVCLCLSVLCLSVSVSVSLSLSLS